MVVHAEQCLPRHVAGSDGSSHSSVPPADSSLTGCIPERVSALTGGRNFALLADLAGST